MQKFLIIFISSLFLIALIIGQCNGDDNNDIYAEDAPVAEMPVSTTSSLPESKSTSLDKESTFVDTTTYRPQLSIDSTALEMPRLMKSTPSQILVRSGYTTSYNNNTKNANWVAWHLTGAHTNGQWSRKGIPYMVDPEVKGPRQELEDWYNHGLPIDHGHMCPAGDNKWSAEAMEQTFLLTNMCPQNSNLNQGDWEELESRCRGWARHYGEVFIACGPIFYSNNYKTIGINKVGIPDAFFKVVLHMGKRPAALGFIYPNQSGHKDISQYVMTVDQIEAKTGIDFFYNLPDNVENVVEAEADIKKW